MRKLIDVPQVPPEQNSFPAVDIVITLQIEPHEIADRASKIKIDPTTGVIYDPISNPVPEADKKLVARLEAVAVDQERLDAEVESFAHKKQDVESFFVRFGFKQLDKPIVTEINASGSPTDVEKQAVELLKEILDYKYSRWYEAEALPEDIKCYLGEEQSSADAFEMIAEKDEDSTSKRASKRGSLNHIAKLQLNSPLGNSSMIFKETGEANLLSVNTRPPGQSMLLKKPSYYSQNLKSLKKVDATSAYSGLTRKDRYYSKCLDAWERIFHDYVGEIEKNLTQAVESLDVLDMQFTTSQRGFVKIFIDSYRRFANDNPDALQAPYCKERLIEKIDTVHDKMWKEIENCKLEAIKERDGLLTKSIITSATASFCKMYLSVVASELNKLYHLKYAMLITGTC
jgi:hypothetical protein